MKKYNSYDEAKEGELKRSRLEYNCYQSIAKLNESIKTINNGNKKLNLYKIGAMYYIDTIFDNNDGSGYWYNTTNLNQLSIQINIFASMMHVFIPYKIN